jgi:DNA-binding NarL/FixJ family response regulator
MEQPIRIMIVDDHAMLREGLVSLLQPQPDFEVVGEAGSVEEAVEKAKAIKPELVLMDYGLPGGSGVEATRAILKDLPETNIVFLTVHEADDDLFAALRSGAKGYLLKNIPVSKMIAALRGLARGEAPLSRQMTSRVLAEFTHGKPPSRGRSGAAHSLTKRELEVLMEMTTGASNREIADRLFVSVNTIKNHVHSILEKLELKDRRAAIRFAREQGLGNSSFD